MRGKGLKKLKWGIVKIKHKYKIYRELSKPKMMHGEFLMRGRRPEKKLPEKLHNLLTPRTKCRRKQRT